MTASQAKASTGKQETALPTFMDHVHELKGRFFWVAIWFAIVSACAYPYFGQIVSLLTKPLGKHDLYYLTPAGGLSFVIKICLYVGVVGTLPALVYHLYKFIAPVMPKRNGRQVLIYTISSILLAACGVVFAYFVSLPAAIGFLVNLNIDNVSAMLTIDSYFSFVMAYIVAGAALFQLPLILLIINSFNRLSARQLMSYQRHNIVVAFILAAVISPTPDVVNQSLLALPMVAMYQLGVLLVWLKNRKSSRAKVKESSRQVVAELSFDTDDFQLAPYLPSHVASGSQYAIAKPNLAYMPSKRRAMEGFTRGVQNKPSTTPVQKKSLSTAKTFSKVQGMKVTAEATGAKVGPKKQMGLGTTLRIDGCAPTIQKPMSQRVTRTVPRAPTPVAKPAPRPNMSWQSHATSARMFAPRARGSYIAERVVTAG